MKKIESLTPIQSNALAPQREKWLTFGLDTSPINQNKARAAISLAYECAGLTPPSIFIWLESPMRGVYGAHFLDQVWDQVRDQVVAQVRDQVWDQVGDQVWDQVGAQVGAQVWAQVGDQVGAQVGRAGYGQHDANWVGFYEYFRRELDIPGTEKIDGLAAVAMECGWWWPFQNAVIITSKPIAIHRDENFRLHAEHGMALIYPDGWGIHAWHGVRVPAHVIDTPSAITIKEIRDEQNAEVRRVMIERMGWNRFCELAELRVIHTDTLTAQFPALPVSETVHADMRGVTSYRKGKEIAELLESEEFKDFDGRPLKFVRVSDPSTGEKYVLRVWPQNKRAYEAVAMTFGMTEDDYRSSVTAHS